MPKYIALLRSVNVVGKNIIRMPELVQALEKEGFKEVSTYIQSGNVIFNDAEESCQSLARRISETVTKGFGLTLHVLVLTPQELSAVVSDNPFPRRAGIDLTKLHVTFLDRDPDPVKAEKLLSYNFPPDEIIIRGKAAYLHCPGGYGRTKYDNTFIEKKLEARATSRNWNTCLKLTELCRQ
ncbi:MAG: DUF1697 domain-containing protein [Bacteroidales bacterium]|jgi:uncharacterized protein (DUF1697 family)|nr:DUF1697 domain-containing protein [Bacteroidales bacterium]